MTRPTTVAAYIAGKLVAIENCEKSENWEWRDRHAEDLIRIVREGPSGSGWDCGTSFDKDRSSRNKLVFFGSYHHMDEMGGYDGWTEHQIIVTPSLFDGIDIKITGRNRNDIKEYLHDLFYWWLKSEVDASGHAVKEVA